MLADVVLGQHLFLLALRRLRLALGILLFPFSSGDFRLFFGLLLMRLLGLCILQTDGSRGIGNSVAVVLPAWQTTINVPVLLLLETHLVCLRIYIAPIVEEVG